MFAVESSDKDHTGIVIAGSPKKFPDMEYRTSAAKKAANWLVQ